MTIEEINGMIDRPTKIRERIAQCDLAELAFLRSSFGSLAEKAQNSEGMKAVFGELTALVCEEEARRNCVQYDEVGELNRLAEL